MKTAAFRECDMRECNIRGANLYGAVLEHAKLDGIQSDHTTQWFRMHCRRLDQSWDIRNV